MHANATLRGFHKQYWISSNSKLFISWPLTLDLDNFRLTEVDFVADSGFLLIIHVGLRDFNGFREFRGFRFLDPPPTHTCILQCIYRHSNKHTLCYN